MIWGWCLGILLDLTMRNRFLIKPQGSIEELDDNQGLVRCQNLFGMINDEQGYLFESHHHYTLALDLCRDAGWRYAETYILINLGISYTDLGDYKNALYISQPGA